MTYVSITPHRGRYCQSLIWPAETRRPASPNAYNIGLLFARIPCSTRTCPHGDNEQDDHTAGKRAHAERPAVLTRRAFLRAHLATNAAIATMSSTNLAVFTHHRKINKRRIFLFFQGASKDATHTLLQVGERDGFSFAGAAVQLEEPGLLPSCPHTHFTRCFLGSEGGTSAAPALALSPVPFSQDVARTAGVRPRTRVRSLICRVRSGAAAEAG